MNDPGTPYDGPAGFGSDGVHYPVVNDELDTTQGLRRSITNDGWVWAADDEPLHNDTFAEGVLELFPGSEDE